MISLFILLSFIHLSVGSAVETCSDIAPCLEASYDYQMINNIWSAVVCITYDSRFPNCIKGGLGGEEGEEEPEPISHACGGDCTSAAELPDDYCKVEEMASSTSICNSNACDSEKQYIEFGFKDGNGCGNNLPPGENQVFGVRGIEQGDSVYCRTADALSIPSDVLCGGGNNDECIFKIPYPDCPTLNPTENPTKTPTLHPTKNPTKTPTLYPTGNPTESSGIYDNIEACLVAATDTTLYPNPVDQAIKSCECNGYNSVEEGGGKNGECTCLCNKGECPASGGGCGSSGQNCNSKAGNPCKKHGVCCCTAYESVADFTHPKKTADFTPPTCDFDRDAYIFTDSYVKNDGQFNAYETTIDRDTSSNDINLLIFGKGAYSDTSGSNALINERDNKQNKNVFGMENATPGATLGIWFLIFVGIAALVIIAITIGVKLKQKKKMDDIKIVIQPQSPNSPQEVTNDNNNDKETQITFEEENENGKNSDNEIENNIL